MIVSNFYVIFSCEVCPVHQINAEKVAVTGKKREQKIYRRHSGRPGGMTEETFDSLQRRIPERIVEHAVRGMLPKGRVSDSLSLCFGCLLLECITGLLHEEGV